MLFKRLYQFCYDNIYIHSVLRFARNMKNLILHGRMVTRKYMVASDKKVAYLINAKVANSSIKASLYPGETKDDNSINFILKSDMRKQWLSKEEKGYFKFTYVRNPYERLVSCYESKYHTDKKRFQRKLLEYDTYLFGYIREDNGFDNFIKRIAKIPESCMDCHFGSQYALTHDKRGRKLVDYIGPYENIEEDYKKIQEKYGLKELPHYNKTGGEKRDWRSYYTLETAEIVYKKYKKDFENFGYEDSYRELIAYIKDRDKE